MSCVGAWTAADLTGEESGRALTAQLKGLGDGAGAGGLGPGADHKLDHLGGQVLWNHWGRKWPEQIKAEPSQRAVLETVAKFSADPPKAPQGTGPALSSCWASGCSG
jgi:phospholipid/cholesterol/gamma-HCH transport system permease protein